jgi:hypothetical protein
MTIEENKIKGEIFIAKKCEIIKIVIPNKATIKIERICFSNDFTLYGFTGEKNNLQICLIYNQQKFPVKDSPINVRI